MRFQPFQKRTREVQHGRKEIVVRKPLQNRPVDILHVLSEDVIEIANRLVQMEAKDESDWTHSLAENERAGAA
jgi:septum formation topological specificity factor MinE